MSDLSASLLAIPFSSPVSRAAPHDVVPPAADGSAVGVDASNTDRP